jgi:crossover junction endodeoxyribonuclease RuvC
VKTSVVGYGRAEKHQVARMVRTLTGFDQEWETEDVSDALAVAICHATRNRSLTVAAKKAQATAEVLH